MSKSSHEKALRKAQQQIAKTAPGAQASPWRQQYHFMPQQGWMNDPNGLVFFRGQYHVFYQYNPYGNNWDQMHWGHAVSDDLLHWTYLPVALAPSEAYDSHPRGGCFSGSAIVMGERLCLLYTGVGEGPQGEGIQTQCLATSQDGIHFEKHPKNPLITAPAGYDPVDFRDPKVWRHGDFYYLVCGGTKDGLGQAPLFRSTNLEDWSFMGSMAESRGEFGTMWECPDVFALGDKHALMFSPIGISDRSTVYLVGDMDYGRGRLYATAFSEVDWGPEYYAPQTFEDAKGRRLIFGWMGRFGGTPWHQKFIEDNGLGWCSGFSIPREIKLGGDGLLRFLPVEELMELRGEGEKIGPLDIGQEATPLTVGNGYAFEMRLRVPLGRSTAPVLCLSVREGQALIELDKWRAELRLKARRPDGGWTECSCPLPLLGREAVDLHIFSDRMTLEVFAADYRAVASVAVYGQRGASDVALFTPEGEARVERVEYWPLA